MRRRIIGGWHLASESLRELILRVNKAYAAGERAHVPELFHENIDWRTFITSEALPIPNRIIGKWHLIEALRKVDAVIEVVRDDILVLVVEGDRAAMICDRTLRQRNSGRVMRMKVGVFVRFQDGRMIEYQEFGDGLDLLEQTLGRSLNVPPAYG
jgi:ketosteroid isomerase-like protein